MQNTRAVIWFAQQIFTFLFPLEADCSPVLPHWDWAWPCNLLWPMAHWQTGHKLKLKKTLAYQGPLPLIPRDPCDHPPPWEKVRVACCMMGNAQPSHPHHPSWLASNYQPSGWSCPRLSSPGWAASWPQRSAELAQPEVSAFHVTELWEVISGCYLTPFSLGLHVM